MSSTSSLSWVDLLSTPSSNDNGGQAILEFKKKKTVKVTDCTPVSNGKVSRSSGFNLKEGEQEMLKNQVALLLQENKELKGCLEGVCIVCIASCA